MPVRIILSIIFCIAISRGMLAQEYHLRVYGGIAYYQGDLSPKGSLLNLSTGHGAYGVYAGTKLSNFLTMGIRVMKTHISGKDADAQNPDTRRRNLHFKSDIYELGLISEWSLNHIFKNLDKYGIKFNVLFGVNVYHYNPKALYENEWIALQPLMTEGQGLRQYLDQKPYHLTQINFPVGLSMHFNLSYNINLGFEFSPRITFNDYLDDVSTIYINYNELKDLKGELTASLANRSGELSGMGPAMIPTGTPRGNPEDSDWYMFTGVYFSYIIGAVKTKKQENKSLLD